MNFIEAAGKLSRNNGKFARRPKSSWYMACEFHYRKEPTIVFLVVGTDEKYLPTTDDYLADDYKII